MESADKGVSLAPARGSAVRVLGSFEDESTVTGLLDALDDSDSGIRCDAAPIISQIQ